MILKKKFNRSMSSLESWIALQESEPSKNGNKNQKLKKDPKDLNHHRDGSLTKTLNDSIGKMHGVLSGGAKLENGALILNGSNSFVMTSVFEKDIHEKTLEAWVQLNDLNQKVRA